MKPYYEHGGVTIYHGDCAEILPFIRADIVLTDPPYGMDYQSNWRREKHKKIKGDEALPKELVLRAIERADAAAYVFCRWDNLADMPPPKSVIAWVKNNWTSGDLEHEHGRQWEACCFYAMPKHQFIKRPSDVIIEPRTDNNRHPTEKPEQLMRKLIAANVGDVVLDPFMGSGTTLRAAKDLGRKAIGVEIEERYCEVAAKRLSQEVFTF